MTEKCAAAIGFRALKGGAAVVAVTLESGPRFLLSSVLPTAIDGDRLSLEPYRVAYEMNRGADGKASAEAEAAIAEGRRCQNELATRVIEVIARELEDEGCRVVGGALFVNCASRVTDPMSYSLASPDHPAVAEALAVREIRLASHRANSELTELDENSLLEVGSMNLGLAETEISTTLKSIGAGTRRWRKDQKNSWLAAWLLLIGGR